MNNCIIRRRHKDSVSGPYEYYLARGDGYTGRIRLAHKYTLEEAKRYLSTDARSFHVLEILVQKPKQRHA